MVDAMPPDAAHQVLATEQVALLQPGGDDAREAPTNVLRDGRGRGLVEDQLEVVASQLATQQIADDRRDIQVAVPGLLIAMPDRPLLHPRRTAARVQVVRNEMGARCPAELGWRATGEALDKLLSLRNRRGPVRRGRVLALATFLPPDPPVPAGVDRRVGADAVVELQHVALAAIGLRICHTCHQCV